MIEFNIGNFQSIVDKWAKRGDVSASVAGAKAQREAFDYGGLLTDGRYLIPSARQFTEAILTKRIRG